MCTDPTAGQNAEEILGEHLQQAFWNGENEVGGLQSRHEKVLVESWVVSWRRSPELMQGPAAWQASHRKQRGYWVASV
jgi:hypothetical protein